ncbi:MAG TPA: DUF4394 domain-containing protein [Chthoniobacteraceae bacterium]
MKRTLFPILVGAILASAPQAQCEVAYGVTLFGELIRFDTAAPGVILSTQAITGLTGQASGEAISAIDFRPANGLLYALGNAPGGTTGIYRLYTLDITTGVAARVGATDFTTFVGTFFGFDFNPQVDRIRVVSDGETNVRLNPIDGMLAGTDTAITPAGDLVAVAYDRNDNLTGTLTTLFGIDSTSNSLVRIGGVDGTPSPNGGTVTTIGPLGVDSVGRDHFDISAITGVAYAALTLPGVGGNASTTTNLYTVNLTTGTAVSLGTVGDGTVPVRAFAVTVPEPTAIGLLACSGLLLGGMMRRRRAGLAAQS